MRYQILRFEYFEIFFSILVFFFKQKTAYEIPLRLVGSEMCIRDSLGPLWAWMFANENPPLTVLFGGAVVITAVVIQFLSPLLVKKVAK